MAIGTIGAIGSAIAGGIGAIGSAIGGAAGAVGSAIGGLGAAAGTAGQVLSGVGGLLAGGRQIVGALTSDGAGGFIDAAGNYFSMRELEDAFSDSEAIFEQNYQRAEELLQGRIEAGDDAIGEMRRQLGLDPGGADFSAFRESPGYQFALEEGQRAIEGTAAARGRVLSGDAVRSAVDYATGLADQTYNQYFNRLTELAGMGADAQNRLVAAGNTAAEARSNLTLGRGQATANAITGTAENLPNLLAGTGEVARGIGNVFGRGGTPIQEVIRIPGAGGVNVPNTPPITSVPTNF